MIEQKEINVELLELRSKLQGSFLLFCQYFYKKLTDRDFIVYQPIGRESHIITCARELTKCARLEEKSLLINIPPGHGKSTLLTMWVAWTMSIYPDSQYIYVSYSIEIATKMTALIKDVMMIPEYMSIFGISINNDSRGKKKFTNNFGGEVAAFGLNGAITGFSAGVMGCKRFSGALVIDDAHKAQDAISNPKRERNIEFYKQGAKTRLRNPSVPIISISQRLHEEDLSNFMIEGRDGRNWNTVILEALDANDNALCEDVITKEDLIMMRECDKYTYWSQYQQKPTSPGDSLFNRDYFVLLDEEPEMLCTFITADTAETTKTYNDKTVYSFFGLYRIKEKSKYQTHHDFALHWIDCVELQIAPKDLYSSFTSFWSNCCRYPCRPGLAAIEKKSTGSTLLSLLDDIRGIEVRDIARSDGICKGQRFLDCQPLVYRKLVSFPKHGKHVELCLSHMEKININDTHRFDDIADTLADACRIGLIDKTLYYEEDDSKNKILEKMQAAYRTRNSIISKADMTTGY